MAAPFYLGDEASAAGWRLAGAQACTPAPGEEATALVQACACAPLVLLAADVAAAAPPAQLRRALSALQPLVLVLPDRSGRVALPDLAARLRAQLGMEA